MPLDATWSAADHQPSRIGEVARLFTKLGVIGFGGPAAHIALMREEVVRRRGWMDDAEFLDWVGACNLIPGPNSTELAIHLGARRAGIRGLVVAGVCFIAPAVLIVSILAWLYRRYGTDPAILDLRYGILPVIIAIVAQAVLGLGRVACARATGAAIAVVACALYLVGVNELLLLAGAGTLAALWAGSRRWPGPNGLSSIVLPALLMSSEAVRISLIRLFLVFLEIGSILYGSGYVLLAFLQRNLVDDLHWLTTRQLLDAIAVGQITPGPVFTTATFVGWQIHGVAGAAVATVGIFLPSFVLVTLLGRIVPWMQQRPIARAFLDGVTAASLGLMAGVLITLTDDAILDVLTAIVAITSLALLIRTRVSTVWLVLGGLAIGLAHLLLS